MTYNNPVLDKEYKKTNLTKIIGIVLLALTLALCVTAAVQVAGSKKKAEHLNDVIVRTEGDKTGVPAYADFGGFFQFATYGDDLGYYIAYDDDFFYIITIAEKDYDYFEKLYDSSPDGYARIWGYTKEIPYEAKKYAIDSLNEEMEEDIVSFGNFEDIFGDVMLEADRESNVFGVKALFSQKGYLTIPGIFLALLGVILFLTGNNGTKTFERSLNAGDYQSERLLSELNSPNAKWYDRLKLYLTDSNVVNVRGAVNPVPYEDIFWAYATRHRTNGIHDYDYLMLCTKDGRQTLCGNGSTVGKKNAALTEEQHTEVLRTIAGKNPAALIGFTKENGEAFRELKNSLKK